MLLSTKILSKLLPEAHIYTCDLPTDDPHYKRYALRKGQEDFFNNNLDAKNITYNEMNSFFLLDKFKNKKFDFIWLDGGHTYPAVAWDTMYAYGAIKDGGVILMHDYNRPGTNVKELMDSLEVFIPEELKLIPFAKYDQSSNVVWLRKE